MFEDRLRQDLERSLESLQPWARDPAQARYQGLGRLATSGFRRFRLAGAGALVLLIACALLSFETGSPDPAVWTMRVVSALGSIAAPPPAPSAPKIPITSPSPAVSPTPGPPESEASPAPDTNGGSESGGTGEGEGLLPTPTSGEGEGTGGSPAATPRPGADD